MPGCPGFLCRSVPFPLGPPPRQFGDPGCTDPEGGTPKPVSSHRPWGTNHLRDVTILGRVHFHLGGGGRRCPHPWPARAPHEHWHPRRQGYLIHHSLQRSDEVGPPHMVGVVPRGKCRWAASPKCLVSLQSVGLGRAERFLCPGTLPDPLLRQLWWLGHSKCTPYLHFLRTLVVSWNVI